MDYDEYDRMEKELEKAKKLIFVSYPYIKRHYEASVFGDSAKHLLDQMKVFLIENNVGIPK